MDDFKRAIGKSIGKGGVKCRCCNIYHRWGSNQKKLIGLSKVGRKRLKEELRKQIVFMDQDE